MNCLILAAGFGTRLRSMSDSKPLVPVAGAPLIEHSIRAAAGAGLGEFTVVTGHRADEVEAFLAALQARIGVRIQAVRLGDWSRPNGFSVVAGAERIDGDYLLLMADHLFDPAILERLSSGTAAADLCLAVDRDLADPTIDLDDATKVETDAAGRVVAIGKALTRYDAIDTGLFRATPRLREAILEAVAEGRPGSLSDGVQKLADRRGVATLDIGAAWWIDVDDPRSHALAEARLERHRHAFRDNAA